MKLQFTSSVLKAGINARTLVRLQQHQVPLRGPVLQKRRWPSQTGQSTNFAEFRRLGASLDLQLTLVRLLSILLRSHRYLRQTSHKFAACLVRSSVCLGTIIRLPRFWAACRQTGNYISVSPAKGPIRTIAKAVKNPLTMLVLRRCRAARPMVKLNAWTTRQSQCESTPTSPRSRRMSTAIGKVGPRRSGWTRLMK